MMTDNQQIFPYPALKVLVENGTIPAAAAQAAVNYPVIPKPFEICESLLLEMAEHERRD